jgi:seryl-tRNA synthetase
MTPENATMEIHEIHGYDTCEQVEDTNKRAWVTVETLTTENRILATQIQELMNKVTSRERTIDGLKSAEENVEQITTFIDDLDQEYGAALSQIRNMTAAATFLPTAENDIRDAWRSVSGKSRGPVPTQLRERLFSDVQTARISAAVQVAFQAAIALEVKEYFND